MIKNILDFLLECDFEELIRLEILNKQGGTRNPYVLNRKSVSNLIDLMEREGIKRLEYPNFYNNETWYLDDKGNFNNPLSTDDIKRGNIDQLKHHGKVFDGTNPIFNPYFKEGGTPIKPTITNSSSPATIEKVSNDISLLHKKKQIILYGPPGTGKTYSTRELAVKILGGDLEGINNEYEKYRKESRVEFITFHPSYSYEEFIEGITVETGDENIATDSIKYKLKPGIFKQICKRALGKGIDSSDEKLEGKSWIDVFKEYETFKDDIDFSDAPAHVLIIDEINRGDIAKIFGELITLLEADKRLAEENELIVKLPASNDNFCVPPNLYIIATMNTADRSIALLDVALRRRFGFIEMNPDFTVLSNHVKKNFDEFEAGLLHLLDKSQKAILEINKKICMDKTIGRDKQIGHSFLFKIYTVADLITVWRHEIFPLLEEYCYGDYLKINHILFGKDTDSTWIKLIEGIQEINRTNIEQMLNEISKK